MSHPGMTDPREKHLNDVLEQWQSSFVASVDALQKRDANLRLPLATRDAGGTSIICFRPNGDTDSRANVEVVSWKDAASKTGYLVSVDSDWLLVPVVHVGARRFPTDYSSAEVIVHQTGVTWTRAKRTGVLGERNELPDHWRRIIQIWRTALNGKLDICELQAIRPLDSAEASELQECKLRCQICNSSAASRQPATGSASSSSASASDIILDDRDLEVFTCPVCLMALHHVCAASAVSALDKMRPKLLPSPTTLRLPSILCQQPGRSNGTLDWVSDKFDSLSLILMVVYYDSTLNPLQFSSVPI